MARRRKTSFFEDLFDIACRLPWWAGAALAGVSYLGLHHLAVAPLDPPAVVGGQVSMLGEHVVRQVVRALAAVAQYLVPLAFGAGALLSAWRARRRESLHARAAAGLVDGMDWRQFETLVGEAFRRHGYAVVETGGGGPDGGVDLVLSRDGERSLVQCKHWRALKVGVGPVRELYGVMAARGAAGGFVVTSGAFTPAAVAFASGRNVTLVDGPALLALVRSARGVEAPVAPRPPADGDAAAVAPPADPVCPVCRAPMVLRTAGRGVNAGQPFWGCSRFPACRGTRDR